MKKKEKSDVKLREKLSLSFRKKWLVNGSKTLLIVLILVATYIALNLWIQELDLPQIDVTENKIYTLSDASKKAIEKLENEVKIYTYGFEEDGGLINFLKQYTKANPKITYEILTEETNYEMIQANDLKPGYTVLILESGDSRKVIDASTEFTSYDYTTAQQIDTTEQVITNSILSLNIANKPKVYFVQGHEEFSTSQMVVLTTYLRNEAFEVDTVNLATTGKVPDDCDVLAIMSPTHDFLEVEKNMVIDYIHNGGDIYYSQDVVSQENIMPNLQGILAEYGVSIENGYIIEYDNTHALASTPTIFMPQVSSSNEITADIYTDSYMWLVYSGRLKFENDDVLQNLKVDKEELLYSSEEAVFVRDLNADMETAAQTAEIGKSTIASIINKKIETGEEDSNKVSSLVLSASGSFISDYVIQALDSQNPLSYLGSNKDFVINSMAKLADKENTLTIRKDMANSTYTPTDMQNRIVITIIFVVPILIIVIGIVVWRIRKRRK